MITFCVFAGSRIGNNPKHMEDARELGRLIGAHGHEMVYGGGTNGLRGACAKAAHDAGATVTAVFPPDYHVDRIEQFEFAKRREAGRTYRIPQMQKMSDVFLFLAGGDTMAEEYYKILGTFRRSEHHKPIILINSDGFWDHLSAFRKNCITEGLIPNQEKDFVHVVDSPSDVFNVLRERTPEELSLKKRDRVVYHNPIKAP